jgi:oligopeptide/dipeptide ABC transporter ATP-binding protein
MGLVGESGCGKSTAIKAILGLLPKNASVTNGSVRFFGEELAMTNAAQMSRLRGSRISFIPQDPFLSMNPTFSVGEQLMEIMRWHAPPPEPTENGSFRAIYRRRLVKLLDRVRIPQPEAALHKFPHQFSGGQRQRILIAAALCCSPQLVIADEPTTALDVTTQSEILVLLKELVEEREVSMLFVSHDLGVIANLCDDVTVMYAGQVMETGSTLRVMSEPRNVYTMELLACHPDRARGLHGIPGTVPSVDAYPRGCRFRDRCPGGNIVCETWVPGLVSLAEDVEGYHLVNCSRYPGVQ